MAVDLCSETFDSSPRISFSHDLRISGIIPVEQTPFRTSSPGSNQSFDFDSCGFDRPGWSPADELFSDGKMIPLLHIKKNVHEEDGFIHAHLPKTNSHRETGEEKEAGTNCDGRNKSFWRFGRSSSLSSSSYGRMGFCPLPLLSRSNSTGSTPTPRANKHSAPKPLFLPRELHPINNNNNAWYQKPPLRRPGNGNWAGRNAVRVDPVLNVVGAGNMFGLCSVFGRDKRKRK